MCVLASFAQATAVHDFSSRACLQTGEQTLTPMTKQITLGWDYWNKKKHNLRRDMLQLHYYMLLEPTITVRLLHTKPNSCSHHTQTDWSFGCQAESFGLCFSTQRSGFMRGCLPCEDAGGSSCEATAEGCGRDTTLAAAQVGDFSRFTFAPASH